MTHSSPVLCEPCCCLLGQLAAKGRVPLAVEEVAEAGGGIAHEVSGGLVREGGWREWERKEWDGSEASGKRKRRMKMAEATSISSIDCLDCVISGLLMALSGLQQSLETLNLGIITFV